jgi:guanosine-3',5'-bis(diphosphate) 3'-pyrophosphohydrolase
MDIESLNDPNARLNRGKNIDKLFIKALAFAADKHKNQRRKDEAASPYINHPISLTNILVNEGEVNDINILVGAILHDTVEDTETSKEELQKEFGEKIASIVMEVTDDKSLPKEERKIKQIEHSAHISDEAKHIKLADKISNLRDIISSPPKDWSQERKNDYFEWAGKVIDQVRGTNSKLESIFDSLHLK